MVLFSMGKKLYIEDLGKSISIIDPHTDDGAIKCGGVIYAARENGVNVGVVVMTDGRFGSRYVEDIESQEKTIKSRKKEAIAAYRHLGVSDIVFLDFPDMGLENYKFFENHINGKRVEGAYKKLLKVLRDRKVETVFIPKYSPLIVSETSKEVELEHVDHNAAHEISVFVCKFLSNHPIADDLSEPTRIKNVFLYGVWNELKKPTHRFRLTEEIEKAKGRALSEFGSQEIILKELENMGIDWKTEKYKMFKLGKK